ncbi:hypothetical protein LUZ61_005517 [Rhynchospora tenuis]|nr:hypothetical protein LUZ61_005517 [Rhynchospora tenuis]
MRPLNSILYPVVNASHFFDLTNRRVDLGGSKITRYPVDPYDRIWYPRRNQYWSIINTTSNIRTTPLFEVPSVVMQTAMLPINTTTSTIISGDPTSGIVLQWFRDPLVENPSYFLNFHFADLQFLPPDGIREFDIFYNGKRWENHFRPLYLQCYTLYTSVQLPNPIDSDKYEFSLNATTNATAPPLINAVEVFNLLSAEAAMTNLSDVDAIMMIKEEYKVKKNWTGDPCAPAEYTWADVVCNYEGKSSRITAL